MPCVSAGTTRHEETSHCAIDEVFVYIEDKFLLSSPGTAFMNDVVTWDHRCKKLCLRLRFSKLMVCEYIYQFLLGVVLSIII